jgi:hypothetical protein
VESRKHGATAPLEHEVVAGVELSTHLAHPTVLESHVDPTSVENDVTQQHPRLPSWATSTRSYDVEVLFPTSSSAAPSMRSAAASRPVRRASSAPNFLPM